ncbi:hypothetical protein MPSEU_000382400 [Mayamaea pseudoterrestris]|nr:hypothetical protein MPSEU_000382400 [Mayamaea pseudoterrestris]
MGRKGRQSSTTSAKGGGSSSSDDPVAPSASPSTAPPTTTTTPAAATATKSTEHAPLPFKTRLLQLSWLKLDHLQHYGAFWLVGCMLFGLLFGFVMGAGSWRVLLEPNYANTPIWKQDLANRIRSTGTFQFVTFRGKRWDDWLDRFASWAESVERNMEAEEYAQNPSHPRIFAVLREAVVREQGGYVHPDLGLLVPAPSGASRGIGMEEVLIRVPLGFQMTRNVALDTLLPIVPTEVQKRASLHELDDAALLVLLLAHERGLGRYSRWVPYIASLPPEPSCGYSEKLKPHMLDTINVLREEIGVDTQGWSLELQKASQYANKIVDGLTFDYAPYLKHPEDVKAKDNIKWALCQVASRATAGSEKHGALRMIPILDLVNHDANAGGFIELTGKEKYRNGDFVDSSGEDVSGAFIVRSMRHGQRKPLRLGQELLVNYNVPHYSPLDWFVSLGFVPPERWGQWHRIEAALPRVRTNGRHAVSDDDDDDDWEEKEQEMIEKIRSMEL